jgi:energy-coupling factor transport system ATP-binding protein
MEIKFNNVSYAYNEGTIFEHIAINKIDLNLEENKIIGIIGKSGSGKTTLIEHLNALLIPSEGTVKIGDYEIKKKTKILKINDLRRKVGLVFQFPEEQFFNPTVKEEVAFALKYFRYKDERVHKQVSEALSNVGLNDTYLECNVFELSAGEKRKVAIASVMVFNPEVIVLDEPTVGLDYKSKKNIIALIKKLKDRYHKTVIIVSHDVDMLNIIADDIIVMDGGKIVMMGEKNEVFKNNELFEKYGLAEPKIVTFIRKAKELKGIKLGNYIDIKDLMKDIYRNV